MKTLQRVLAIVGGAFLIGTGQAVLFGPVSLGPVNLTDGIEDVTPNPDRIPVDPSPQIDGKDSPEVTDSETTGNAMMEDLRNTTPSTTNRPVTDPLLDAPVPEGTLTLRETKELWDLGAYFIDARHEEEFDAGHIMYASLLLAQWFDTDPDRAFAVTDSIPVDATVVIYCVGGECDASKNTAAWLEPLGYSDLRIMGAGFEHWAAAGFEIETSIDEGTP